MPEILPDLLSFDDGSAVAAQDWERRRQQLHDAILPHEYGGMPPVGMETRGILLCSSSIRSTPGITYRSIEVRTRFAAADRAGIVLDRINRIDRVNEIKRRVPGPLPRHSSLPLSC